MYKLRSFIKLIPGVKQYIRLRNRVFTALTDASLESNARNIERELQLRALKDTADYVDANMRSVKSYGDRYALLDAALKTVEIEGIFLEFGVWSGNSVNYIASKINDHIYGFDSFEGLPEDWKNGLSPKNTFKLSRLPKTGENVTLIQGFFDKSLPEFFKKHTEDIAFIHIDCDLYSSTKTVFDFAGNQIVRGSVLVFDEYFNYTGWRHGEFLAFQEYCRKNDVEYEYLGYCRYSQQVAVKIQTKKRA